MLVVVTYKATQPLSPSQVAASVMPKIVPLTSSQAEDSTQQFVVTFILFFHRLIVNIADNALDLNNDEEEDEAEAEEEADCK